MDRDTNWVVVALPVHGWKIVTAEGNETIVSDIYDETIARQIIDEHNAVVSAIKHGRNWIFEDWQNWYRYRLTGKEQG